ncbi:hypothetical protein RJ640_013944 [Escallonia rubra]|uniref:Pentatricopeptide repeat-containing protein n=1 Tax=Escallonia rubra TaxID=112253 RepID=A0AA88U7M2_9ASTE|nr:hypothetical protein RJ640_013944 [Escallonia rubra]
MRLNGVAAVALACHRPVPDKHGTSSSLLLLPPPLLQFFSLGFHSSMTSNVQIHRIDFNKIKKLEDVFFLFDEMLRMRPLPSTLQFTLLLTDVTKMKHYSASLSLYKEMGALGIPINEYIMCWNWVLNPFFFRRGIVPNVATFGILLKGLVLEDRVPEAVILFTKLIRERVCEPNEVMYGTIVSGLCKTGNTSRAIQLLRLMEEEGKCKPNTVIDNTVVDGLCKDRMVDDALILFTEMIEKCIPPNVVTYNSMIHGLCINERWNDAIRLLREMVERKIFPDVHT